MKKNLFFLLLLFIAGDYAEAKENSAIWNGKTDIKWYNDSETEFTITTPEQLAGLAKLVNKGNSFEGKTVKLGANIMLNDTTDWQNWANKPPKNKWKPIGIFISQISERTPRFLHNHLGDALMYFLVPQFIQQSLRLTYTNLSFNGTFDGNGFVISGVYINTLKDYQGLFGKYNIYDRENRNELRNLGIRASYIKGGVGVGGLVGTSEGSIVNCYSAALVSGQGTVGGLVGSSSYTIRGSYSTGKVIGQWYVGGLVGGASGGSSIKDSYSTGVVFGDTIVGGLVGWNFGGITNSYSIGAVTGKNNIGGLVGKNEKGIRNIIHNSFYNVETSGQSDVGKGNGQSSIEMKERATFVGWDFDKIWGIDGNVNGGYPYLLEVK